MGGGWTVLNRRYDGSTNFYQNWKEYKEGFGKLHREFWIGNDNMHVLSFQAIFQKGSEALIQLRPHGYTSGTIYTNGYSHFYIGNEKSKYMMDISGVAYNEHYAADFASYNNRMEFSAKGSYNDKTLRVEGVMLVGGTTCAVVLILTSLGSMAVSKKKFLALFVLMFRASA